MKKLILLLTLLPILAFSQTKSESGIKMTSEYGSENQELQDIMNLENIDYYKVKFIGDDLKGKNFQLIVKEMWNGKIKEVDTVVNTSKNERMLPIKSDTLNLRVTAKKSSENELKLVFRFPQFGNEKTFKATSSDDYSLKDVGTNMDIEIGKEFSAFAYILPYEKDGWKMWCAVDSSGKDIESWGKEFGIEHYLIFEMKFE
ncbi:hypothetical protein [Winogradskyella sediminis]|uniref:Uncharacterized protein n=1 Tax=Winogradskyella sediminis TaxID=1382466 RepID=A0A1H1X4U4_9FLAO|nr:hypothetical protein [Winogradskyella sediminis]SDT03626.1 hypothetical protein SAMN04489797_3080 [Winogradskyella sediminis]